MLFIAERWVTMLDYHPGHGGATQLLDEDEKPLSLKRFRLWLANNVL